MRGSVFALLVGINDYGGRVSPLAGTHDDVLAFEAFLTAQVPEGRRHVRRLLDGEATRQAVIEGFTKHLSGARDGDVALFYFSGHGSEEPVAQRYWALEPTGWNQTLVCFDSRTPGVPDLADKELNQLVRGITANGAHVVLCFDCCHSGGANRAGIPPRVRARLAPRLQEPRPDEEYLPEVRQALAGAARDASASATGWHDLPPHVALAACESQELSLELPIGEEVRGVFSAMLQRALGILGPGASYRDLIGATSAAVRDRVADQHPVGFAEDPASLDQPLFGGAVRLRRSRVTLEHVTGAWWVDAGRVHGVQPPLDGRSSVFAVLPPSPAVGDTEDEGTTPPGDGRPLGHVQVTEVEPGRSRVVPTGSWAPASGTRYPVVLVDLPLPPARVELVGDSPAWDAVRDLLRSSPHVREGSDDPGLEGDRFRVVAGSSGLTITRPDGSPLTDGVPADRSAARRVVDRLEHLARWHHIKRLDNPVSALTGTVTMDLVAAEPGAQAPPPGSRVPLLPADNGEFLLEYRATSGGWQPPYVFVYITNGSDRNLYLTLLDLTDRFRCHGRLFPVDLVPAGQTVAAFTGKPIDVTVPDERLKAGGDTVYDWLKVFASEDRFAAQAYELPNLDGVISRAAVRRGAPRSVLDRLAVRTMTRDAGGADIIARPAEWTTARMTLRTVHPGIARAAH
ncbi:caspase family protein [Geodermatophilus sp. SYSU D01062]